MKCRLCGGIEYLKVAHILSREKYPELSLKIDNLLTLCGLCDNRYGERLNDENIKKRLKMAYHKPQTAP